MLLVSTRPAGAMMRPSLSPTLSSDCVSVARRLASTGFSARRPLPPTTADQSMPVTNVSRSAAGCPGGVAGADQRAHAGARDAVDRHAHLLEHLEHADVRAALRAAAGEHEPDTRALAGGAVLCGRRRRDGEHRGQQASERGLQHTFSLSCGYLSTPTDERPDERGVLRRICKQDWRSEAEARRRRRPRAPSQ